MTTLTLDTPAQQTSPRRAWGLGLFLIAEALLSLAPMAVLGPAIGWPASLGQSAAQQLTAVAAAPGAVQSGYAIYLVYSLLIAPLMIVLAARTFGSLAQPLAATVAAFGALSALARAIGMLRWLAMMPVLASAHAGADPATRSTIEWVFQATTRYGGGIGELLGVSLLMAASLGLLCAGALRQRKMPAWLAVAGLISAAALAGRRCLRWAARWVCPPRRR